MDVVGVGALNLDLIYEIDFNKLPKGGKYPQEIIGRERGAAPEEFSSLLKKVKKNGRLLKKSGGGSAANTVYAMAKMGFSCGFIGKVGKDKEGKVLLKELKEVGVDTTKIKQEGKSGICLILLDKKGERSIFISPNINDTLRDNEVDIDYINKAKFLHMTSFLGEISFATQKRIAKEAKVPLSFDPGEPHATKGLKKLMPILKRSFILFPTEKEVEILTGKDYKNGAKELLGYGAKIVVCTRGEKGSYIISQEGEWEIPARKEKVVDTTGAGDVYAAGFLAGLLKGASLPLCGRLATKSAAQSIKGYGKERYPSKELLTNFLKEQG
ncbi:carbohydrate kinase family protein [Candidatus Aerophobetes bacterium]|nr:carbohydrate kinase family protein [Candidatus Aerophobetes bacterium]